MKFVALSAILLTSFGAFAQLPTAEELLTKSIQYHDPKGNWPIFDGVLSITAEYPDGAIRESKVSIDLPSEYFMLEEKRGDNTTQYSFDKGTCLLRFNGKTDFDEETKKQYRLSCERGKTMKDYYTYLYGLPMKLRDAGTLIAPKVEEVKFLDKKYLRLKVTYDPSVGSDTWYFYFDPITYAMEVYQFYHDESKNDGEYILLEELVHFKSLKIPKSRHWYTNAGQKLLATDHLKAVSASK